MDSGTYHIKAKMKVGNKSCSFHENFTYHKESNLYFSSCMDHAMPELVRVIKTDPVAVNYSDVASYQANITTIFGTPLEGLNVTFFVYNHTEDYPWILNLFPSLQKYYDYLWFYTYWYVNEQGRNCPFHDVFDFLLNKIRDSCWVHPIGSAVTDEQGIARVNHSTYLHPDSYNLVALVDFAPLLSECVREFFGIEHVWLYRIFMDQVNVSREASTFTPINLNVRYSDESNISVRLTDNEGNPHASMETFFIPHDSSHEPIIASKMVSFYLFLNEKWVHVGDGLTDENGTATINYTPWLTPGEYKLEVEFLGDSLYAPSEAIYNLTVKKECVYFSNLNFTSRYSDLGELMTKLQDDEQNPIPQDLDLDKNPRSISFYLYYEDNWHDLGTAITDLQGIARLNYTPWIMPETYQIMLAFLGDDYYYPLVKYGNLTVQKEFTKLEFLENISALQQENPIPINNLTMVYSDSRDIVTRLTDDEGTLFIPYRWINLFVDDLKINENLTITGTNGFSLFNYTTWLIPNTHNLTAGFQGDEYFNPTNQTIELKIEKEITQLNVVGILTYSDQGKIEVNLTDDEGSPVYNKSVLIDIDFEGNLVFTFLGSVMTNLNGTGFLNYTPWEKPHGYLMNGTFEGDSYYENCHSLGVLVINKEQCNIEVDDVTVMQNVTTTFQATLKEDDGPPLEGANIEFYIKLTHIEEVPQNYLDYTSEELLSLYSYLGEIINMTIKSSSTGAIVTVKYWSYIDSNLTNSTGISQLEWNATIDIGKYDVKAVFRGNDNYFACNGTDHVSIIPIKVNITINGYWINSHYKLEILVLDENGNPVPNLEIQFFIFNNETRTFSITTNETGQAIVMLYEPIMGKYTLIYTIAGTSFISDESLYILGIGRPSWGLAALVPYWIIIGSNYDFWSAYLPIMGAYGLLAAMVGLIAWAEKGDFIQGIPWGAVAAAVLMGFGLALTVAEILLVYTWDWALQEVFFYLWIQGANIIGLYPSFAWQLGILQLKDLLAGKPENSVGLVVLGPDSRYFLLAYFLQNETEAKKLIFLYLGYAGSAIDALIYYQITNNAFIIGFANIDPYYYKIAQFSSYFFRELILFNKPEMDWWDIQFVLLGTQALIFPVFALIVLSVIIAGIGLELYLKGCVGAGVFWTTISLLYLIPYFIFGPIVIPLISIHGE